MLIIPHLFKYYHHFST